MTLQSRIYPNLYKDSVALMTVSAQITAIPGIAAASVVMGTASTIACMIEGLGMSLPGSASIPATHADRIRIAEAVVLPPSSNPRDRESLIEQNLASRSRDAVERWRRGPGSVQTVDLAALREGRPAAGEDGTGLALVPALPSACAGAAGSAAASRVLKAMVFADFAGYSRISDANVARFQVIWMDR